MNKSTMPALIKTVFIISLLWWVFLFFITQIVVVFDAGNYEDAGKLIAHQGFVEYLREGPQREPMYPLLVALSMTLGQWGGIAYYYPIKIIQIFFLLLTMFFSWRLMKLLGVRDWIAGLILLYMGFSPVMSTSSMRLWSEIAAFPWVVLAVLWTIKSWEALDKMPDDRVELLKILKYAAMVAGMFLLIMFDKAVAEGVLLFYLWPFYLKIVSLWRAGRFIKAKQVAVFCFSVLLIFEAVVVGYKFLNYQYNGNFVFTTRGESAFYGNTVRRMEPLTGELLGTAIVSITAGSECYSFFSAKACDHYSIRYVDDIVAQKIGELHSQGITGKAESQYFISNTLKMILANPLQELLLMIIDAQKMFFWEGDVSFVAYPNWLERIFYSPLLYNVTKYAMAILSWGAFVFGLCYVGRHAIKATKENKTEVVVLFWIINFIFWYMAMYSLFLIVNRYAFPVASLYLVLAAFMLHRILKFFIK